MSLIDDIRELLYFSPFNKKQREKDKEKLKEDMELSFKKIDISSCAGSVVDHLGIGGVYTDSGLKIVGDYSDSSVYWNGEVVFSKSIFSEIYEPGEWEELLKELAKYVKKQDKIFFNICDATNNSDETVYRDEYTKDLYVDYVIKDANYNDHEKFNNYTFEKVHCYHVYYKMQEVFSVEYANSGESFSSYINHKFYKYEPGEWEEIIDKVAKERKKTPEEIKEEKEKEKQKQKSIFEERLRQLKDLNNK